LEKLTSATLQTGNCTQACCGVASLEIRSAGDHPLVVRALSNAKKVQQIMLQLKDDRTETLLGTTQVVSAVNRTAAHTQQTMCTNNVQLISAIERQGEGQVEPKMAEAVAVGSHATQAASRVDQLTKLNQLRKDGILTEDEFSAEKDRVLRGHLK
jgi:hypothetical protein